MYKLYLYGSEKKTGRLSYCTQHYILNQFDEGLLRVQNKMYCLKD